MVPELQARNKLARPELGSFRYPLLVFLYPGQLFFDVAANITCDNRVTWTEHTPLAHPREEFFLISCS